MTGKRVLVAVGLFVFGSTSFAMVLVHRQGNWPDAWPEELEPLRKRATTYDVAAGNQEIVYEIPFTDRAEFERLWPAILQVKAKGGKLTLLSVSGGGGPPSLSEAHGPAVRIAAPCGSSVQFKEAEHTIYMGPPWPEHLHDENGQLPEYVTWDGEQLVGVNRLPGGRGMPPFSGFLYRARVGLTLVVDGRVIDLNRIPLPGDTLIVDGRQLPATQPAEDDPTTSAPADQQADLPELSLPEPADYLLSHGW
jgi:hypothetical protein